MQHASACREPGNLNERVNSVGILRFHKKTDERGERKPANRTHRKAQKHIAEADSEAIFGEVFSFFSEIIGKLGVAGSGFNLLLNLAETEIFEVVGQLIIHEAEA